MIPIYLIYKDRALKDLNESYYSLSHAVHEVVEIFTQTPSKPMIIIGLRDLLEPAVRYTITRIYDLVDEVTMLLEDTSWTEVEYEEEDWVDRIFMVKREIARNPRKFLEMIPSDLDAEIEDKLRKALDNFQHRFSLTRSSVFNTMGKLNNDGIQVYDMGRALLDMLTVSIEATNREYSRIMPKSWIGTISSITYKIILVKWMTYNHPILYGEAPSKGRKKKSIEELLVEGG